MTDITIYKPPSVTVRALGGGRYVLDKPASMTISAINGLPPINQTVLVAALTAQVETLTRELAECRSARSAGQGWPVNRSH